MARREPMNESEMGDTLTMQRKDPRAVEAAEGMISS